MSIKKEPFGVTAHQEKITKYTLTNESGASVSILDLGCAIQSLFVPNKNGDMTDVTMGFDNVRFYEESSAYLGAVVGRYGNRIGKGRFTLGGEEYSLYCNDGSNHLHGGQVGLSRRVWSAEESCNGSGLKFKYFSPDGEDGYPANVSIAVEYIWGDDNSLEINYFAESDGDTILNLTNHAYFNLGGHDSGSVLSHELWSSWDRFVETDAELIPTGRVLPVEGTPFDFSGTKTIGEDFDLDYEPLALAGGYDHCLMFPENSSPEDIKICACDKQSGIVMEVMTDRPAVQFYSANFLSDSERPLKGGIEQRTQTAFCLETQLMPDSINHEGFTDCVLHKGDILTSKTKYRFSVK